MNRQQRRAAAAYKRKCTSGEWGPGTVIHVQTIRRRETGELYRFEYPKDFSPEDGLPDGTQLYGPFQTEAEANERLVLLGPQCELKDGGMWDPAWQRPQ